MASMSNILKSITKGAKAAANVGQNVAGATLIASAIPTLPAVADTAAAAAPAPAPAAPAQPAAPATPYLDIAKSYEDKARANFAQQEQALAQQLAASKNASNREYDSAASANYINYLRQKNALPEQLAAQGINGGASETAGVNMMNNYAMNQGNTAASRYAALAQLQSAHDTSLANMRQAMEDNIMNNNLALEQAQVQYEDTLAQRAAEQARYDAEVAREQARYDQETAKTDAANAQAQKDAAADKKLEQFSATVGRFDTIEKCDAAIKRLKKSSDPNAQRMIWLVQNQKATLKAAGKK